MFVLILKQRYTNVSNFLAILSLLTRKTFRNRQTNFNPRRGLLSSRRGLSSSRRGLLSSRRELNFSLLLCWFFRSRSGCLYAASPTLFPIPSLPSYRSVFHFHKKTSGKTKEKRVNPFDIVKKVSYLTPV